MVKSHEEGVQNVSCFQSWSSQEVSQYGYPKFSIKGGMQKGMETSALV